MRIDLLAGYHDREKVKALGARWDPFRRVWYLLDPPDLIPFEPWLPVYPSTSSNSREGAKEVYPVKRSKISKTTSYVNVPDCDCKALPWQDCIHTAIPIGEHYGNSIVEKKGCN